MALLQGYYPADARLILNPDDYTTGGTDLGKLGSIQMVDVAHEFEFINEHISGTTNTGARMIGTQATLIVHLEEFSNALIELVNNNTADGDDFDGFTGYNVGDFLAVEQYSRLQVRPVDKAGNPVSNKPHVYMPMALCLRGFNPMFGKRAKVTDGFVLLIKAFLDVDNGYTTPALFGDPTTLPAIVVPE